MELTAKLNDKSSKALEDCTGKDAVFGMATPASMIDVSTEVKDELPSLPILQDSVKALKNT